MNLGYVSVWKYGNRREFVDVTPPIAAAASIAAKKGNTLVFMLLLIVLMLPMFGFLPPARLTARFPKRGRRTSELKGYFSLEGRTENP